MRDWCRVWACMASSSLLYVWLKHKNSTLEVLHEGLVQGVDMHGLLLTTVCVAETQEQYTRSTP